MSEIMIDSEQRPLGAYTFAVLFDPAVVVIMSIGGGTTPEFSSPPITNQAEFQTGRARLLAFNSSSLESPIGIASVARVTFHVVGAPDSSTRLALEIVTLADTDGGRFEADTNECDVRASAGTGPTASATVTPRTTTATPTATAFPTQTPTPTPTASPSPDATPTSTAKPVACIGDCDDDLRVTVDEILRGVNIALGELVIGVCRQFDASVDGSVTVEELVGAVSAALDGCPRVILPTSTGTPTASTTPSATCSPTPTITASPRQNRAPTLPRFREVNAYVGHPLSLALGAEDPDGDMLHYAADSLPTEATLDALAGILRWTPGVDQVGFFFAPVTCTDDGDPALSARTLLALRTTVPDACLSVSCTPLAGCEVQNKPLSESCCSQRIDSRTGHALPQCPEGRAIYVGRNNQGFGRLQNCDRLRVINFLQAGASVRFHLEARCLNTVQPLQLWARLETRTRLVFERTQMVTMEPAANGYARKFTALFPVAEPGPFFDLEGAEGLLAVSLTDADGITAENTVRLMLTFESVNDLPEVHDAHPPSELRLISHAAQLTTVPGSQQ